MKKLIIMGVAFGMSLAACTSAALAHAKSCMPHSELEAYLESAGMDYALSFRGITADGNQVFEMYQFENGGFMAFRITANEIMLTCTAGAGMKFETYEPQFGETF